jgi:hypothetical protein
MKSRTNCKIFHKIQPIVTARTMWVMIMTPPLSSAGEVIRRQGRAQAAGA